MASVRDTATFFAEGSASQFEYVLSLYNQVLRLKAERKTKKPEELIKLDYWYQNELPKKIKSRGKDAHLNHEELIRLMKWKQSRGKFFPQVNYLIKVNTPRAVVAETKKAFRKLPNLEQAITALSNLKGVGTTMASALLAAAAPEKAPFMADECLMAIPDIEGIDYTTKEYLNFVNHISGAAQRLNSESKENGKWSPHRVELALWTHFVASELQPELLESIPNGTSAPAHSNGETNNDNTESVSSTEQSDENSLDCSSSTGAVTSGDNGKVVKGEVTQSGETTTTAAREEEDEEDDDDEEGGSGEQLQADSTTVAAADESTSTSLPDSDNNNESAAASSAAGGDHPPPAKKPRPDE